MSYAHWAWLHVFCWGECLPLDLGIGAQMRWYCKVLLVIHPRRHFWDPGRPGLSGVRTFYWESQWNVRTPESELARVPKMPPGIMFVSNISPLYQCIGQPCYISHFYPYLEFTQIWLQLVCSVWKWWWLSVLGWHSGCYWTRQHNTILYHREHMCGWPDWCRCLQGNSKYSFKLSQ